MDNKIYLNQIKKRTNKIALDYLTPLFNPTSKKNHFRFRTNVNLKLIKLTQSSSEHRNIWRKKNIGVVHKLRKLRYVIYAITGYFLK